ncbi:MAG TPA: hypothetical protein VMM76_17380 [Pirellulaceae bacterium]|nr:hypothetical protein [Pirellulaceae bacterium]
MRWQTAIARAVVLDVCALFTVLLIDFSLRLETVPRAVVISVAVGVLAWRKLRHILPDLLKDETIVDIALLLERTHGEAVKKLGQAPRSYAKSLQNTDIHSEPVPFIHSLGMESDLVAALQFDAAATSSVGSLALQRAVIERVAKSSETLDLRSAVPRKDAWRASRLAVVAVLSVSMFWLSFPAYANAFWNRLWLGDANYPTRTNIERVAINGRSDAARVVEGETVVFAVKCSGVTPNEGLASLRGIETGDSTSVVLKRVDESSNGAVYAADGPRLNEPIAYSLQIGDAKTEPRGIQIIRRPLIELTTEAVAPAYMHRDPIRQLERSIQVMEGSGIEFSVRCTNGKRLTEIRFQLTHDGVAEDSAAIAFVPTDDAGTTWHLTAKASGMTRVVKEFRYRVVAKDEDGLGTYHPIEGVVRVKRDRAPTATLASRQYAVMPNARPTISYTVEDDFGVGAAKLRVRPTGSRGRNPAAASTRDGRVPAEFSDDFDDSSSFALPLLESSGAKHMTAHGEAVKKLGQAPRSYAKSLQNTDIHSEPVPFFHSLGADYVLELSPFELVKGDKLLVWIEVTDDRGEWPGVSAVSESIELEVMDERGVLDAILRSDADAEQMLTEVIEKELGLKGDQ